MTPLHAVGDTTAELRFDPAATSVSQLVDEGGRDIDEAFGGRGVSALRWRAPVGHTAARRAAWALGFSFEGTVQAGWSTAPRVDAWTATLLAADGREPKTRWLETMPLSGGGVSLRAPTLTDEARYLETMADPETLVWLGTVPIPRTSEGYRASFAARDVGCSLGAAVEWAVADPDDRYLGTINLFGLLTLNHESAEVGYRTHPDARGRGVLSTALRLVIGHAFADTAAGGLGLQRISLGAAARNAGSQGVARACGFTRTGVDRRCYALYDGSVADLVRFDLLKGEELPPPG